MQQDKCSASVQAQLIMDCINLLQEENITVKAVDFDVTFTNQATAVKPGCKMKVLDMKSWFSHPLLKNLNACVIFDTCHMIKLVKNLFGDYKVVCHEVNSECQMTKWQYIEALNTIQENIGLSFANKLKQKTHYLEKAQDECENGSSDIELISCISN